MNQFRQTFPKLWAAFLISLCTLPSLNKEAAKKETWTEARTSILKYKLYIKIWNQMILGHSSCLCFAG